MPLEDAEKTKLHSYFVKIANAQNMEEEDVIALFSETFEELETLPSLKGKSRRVIVKRAKSALNAKFNNELQEGDPFIIIPFGPLGRPKDWNDTIFIDNDAEAERPNIKGLVNDGRVMFKMVDGKRIPVSKITVSHTEKWYMNIDTEEEFAEPADDLKEFTKFIVDDGDDWKKGQPLIYRDHRPTAFGRVNYQYTHTLLHRWELSLVGLAFPKGQEDTRLFEIKLRYDQADVNHENFFLKKHEMFRPYIGNFKLNEKKTTEWRYILNSKRTVVKSFEIDFGDEGLDLAIEDDLGTLEKFEKKALKIKIGKGTDQLPVFLDGYSELEEYHDEQVLKTASGKAMKSKGGWDRKIWNKYAVMVVDVASLIEPDEGTSNSYRFVLEDAAAGKTMSVWSNEYITKIPRPMPATCLAMVQTDRKPDRYDPVTKSRIPDLDNGEIIIRLLSINSLPDNTRIPEMEGV